MITYPVSIGRMDWRTPLGETRIIEKIRHPSWYPPMSIREEHERHGEPLLMVVPPGPHNPLTEFEQLLARVPGDTTAAIDWDAVRTTLTLANGIPVKVGLAAG